MNTSHEDSIRFAVLGPVRAWRGEQELDLGSPQQRVVLTALLLRRGRPVMIRELVDAVWGERPPAAAVSVLRTYVSRLRRALEPGRGTAGAARVIVSVTDGYLVRVPDDALDLGLFERRVAEARKLRAAGEESAAADLLHAALGTWQGTPLAGLSGPLAETERARLDEERLTTLETRLDLDIQLGRHREVIAELASLAGDHPLREQLCLLLMLALYRSGRQAEALAAYRGARGVLVAELGIEPGAPLRELHDLILAADPSLTPSPTHEPADPPPDTPDTRPGGRPGCSARPAQLPADLPTFTGRHDELDRTRALLSETGDPPSTVVISAIGGMAGIGKTALAVRWAHEVADRFPDGQLYVNLRGFDPTGSVVAPEEAIRAFLGALGVPAQRIPTQLDALAALYRTLLADRRVLILLDNARDTDQVRPLLPGSPGCLVIVTSRNQLTGLVAGDGAHPLTLNPLTPAEAQEFLARRLGAARPAAEPRAAEAIIAHCARLPLALAIVSARAAAHPGFPLSAIADELRDSHGSLDAFAGGELSADIRAVFSWSYHSLSAPAARLFRLLGLHSGPCVSAPAAAALAGLPLRETRGLLVELTRAHLLTEHLPGRYTLHDLLRFYAAERVRDEEAPQERDGAVERLLAWYLHTADATYPFLTPHRRRVPLEPPPPGCHPLTFTAHDQALNWCETERLNLVAAVHQAAAGGQPGIAWRLPAVLWGFFYVRSHLHDWLDTTRTGLAAARGAHDRVGEARALADRSNALNLAGRHDESIDHLHQALALCRRLGDTVGRTAALGNLGDAYQRAGRLRKAVEYHRRSLAIDRITGNVWGLGIGLANLGDTYQRLGRFDEAAGCLEEALTVLRASGNRWVEGVTLDILGTVRHRLGRHDDAVGDYRRALEAHRDVGNRWGEGHTLGHLGEVLLAAGRPEQAHTSWRQALAIFEELDHPDAGKVRESLRRLDGRTPDTRPVPVSP
ncbi:BTAD domain-containing putative transcriptional regulator [Streptomyces sp. TRM 70361]|uniref:AfsR/SARP family transcriptional regulator n=1 Tax=Streptomyces sp. TRM 70361 TaxID=3116553 RepID=UPI002E7C4D34|nr:BTAD domain-containing putative transcriptional regulator [Streptomyces sp. TRM 70361]MEE1940995.1 BTAD domain-containing putative transcriptional regulator [Streptomyces sp. TRM 70361]